MIEFYYTAQFLLWELSEKKYEFLFLSQEEGMIKVFTEDIVPLLIFLEVSYQKENKKNKDHYIGDVCINYSVLTFFTDEIRH